MSRTRRITGSDARGRPVASWDGPPDPPSRYGFMEPAHVSTIERRTATPEELEAARAREAQPDPLRHRPSPMDELPTSPGVKKRSDIEHARATARPPEPPPVDEPEEEEPVDSPVTLPPPASDLPSAPDTSGATTPSIDLEALASARGFAPGWTAVGRLADAVLELIEADTERTVAQTRWIDARAAVDEAYRALDETPFAPVETRADHAETIPLPVAAPARSNHRQGPSAEQRNGERDRRGARAMEALERHGGDQRAAAAEMGMRANAFAMVVKSARARVGS